MFDSNGVLQLWSSGSNPPGYSAQTVEMKTGKWLLTETIWINEYKCSIHLGCEVVEVSLLGVAHLLLAGYNYGLLTVKHLKQTTINMMNHYTYWKTAKFRLFRQGRVLIFREYIRIGCRVLYQPEVCIGVNRSTFRDQNSEFTLTWAYGRH